MHLQDRTKLRINILTMLSKEGPLAAKDIAKKHGAVYMTLLAMAGEGSVFNINWACTITPKGEQLVEAAKPRLFDRCRLWACSAPDKPPEYEA